MSNNDTTVMLPKPRLLWLDWMKVLSMFCIVLGHCWVPGNQYIYVFSVPAFFIMSGYTAHHDKDKSNFWKKLFWNMVVPMILFFASDYVVYLLSLYVNGKFDITFIVKGPLLAIAGMQGQNFAAGGLKAMWFIYTLCLCKILFQYIPATLKIKVSVLLSLLFLAVAVYLHKANIILMNSFVNVLLAYPFFCLGNLIRDRVQLPSAIQQTDLFRISIIALLSLIVVFLCGKYNGIVLLYKCSYGSSILLCLVGGFSGTAFIYSLSCYLSLLFNKLNISIIGGGTLVVLGLHPILILLFNNLFRWQGYALYMQALLIFLSFIPINLIVKRFVPIAWGKFRV